MAKENPYKHTIFLPQTTFDMRASLSTHEPLQLKIWEDQSLYAQMINLRTGQTPYILHDGPPYANGNIHHGHCLNKILKDITVKFKHLDGYQINFIPGWDCHGLPIEHEVEKQEKVSLLNNTPRIEIRKRCRAYAQKFVNTQREQFKRLGILGDWAHPYITMDPAYEAKDLEVLAKFVKTGVVYKRKRPVHWCGVCQTSLAGSEVEYQDIEDDSIYVICPFSPENKKLPEKLRGAAVVFWTTTPWSIPAVLAISLKTDAKYEAYGTPKGIMILALDLKSSVEKACKFQLGPAQWTGLGQDLEGLRVINPLTQKSMPLILGEHVSLETGTGCVSTAPGHGEDDYQVGLKYNLDIYCPVDPQGKFSAEVPAYQGLTVFEANPKITADLERTQKLLGKSRLMHSYPHCWRSKNPAVLRATEQWFIDVDKTKLRKTCLEAIPKVKWLPDWSLTRMIHMLQGRPDWCISRQRAWGVPIPSVVCKKCFSSFVTEDICLAVAKVFKKTGADAWDQLSLTELIPSKLRKCVQCGASELEKENNILDVWFDSGISFAAVMEDRLDIPVSDLYLEGNDQYRGWFQSSLLAACGWQKTPPYKSVVVHGMILDERGHKYSKSSANFEPPEMFIKQRGADVMRLWVASENFQEDMTFSQENIKRVEDVYRKIRNTLRFMMGVIGPWTQPPAPPSSLKHPLHQYLHLKGLVWLQEIQDAYEAFEFNKVFHLFNQFMTNDLSGFYLDICKDSLYCDAPQSPFRQEAIQVIAWLGYSAIHYLAPITSFLAEDAYQHFPLKNKASSVFLSPTTFQKTYLTSETQRRLTTLTTTFNAVHQLRSQVLVACERLRNDKKIKTNAQAQVTLSNQKYASTLQNFANDLPLYLGVSEVLFSNKLTSDLAVIPTPYQRCERCWNFRSEVGTLKPTDVCRRCSFVLSA